MNLNGNDSHLSMSYLLVKVVEVATTPVGFINCEGTDFFTLTFGDLATTDHAMDDPFSSRRVVSSLSIGATGCKSPSVNGSVPV